ncbi:MULTISPECIES: hypothetical protein [unclassified Methylophilus]|uniref:hypothetical protein n=1 Tax=unclassified Methylophilus TaxID=2630143 RepID=UPI0006F98165|nr:MULTISPECIES: hypothetical protein [unclassified Methylophilus]KQT42616.1 hypothetical protein ASG34_07780 [Methylophilus sp. Leaf416]KQT56801.1 hypothetical protein ASG44_07755 [Methylophilus sp. Leaf459]
MCKKNKDWILQASETRRVYSTATWVPLRASVPDQEGDVQKIGYLEEYLGVGTAAIHPEYIKIGNRLDFNDLGGHRTDPYVHSDGRYTPIDHYQYNDETIGVELVFEHIQSVIGKRHWILNPDLVVALDLIKEGNSWVRPVEDFTEVARERVDSEGNHYLIEIKREFLMDYLAARNLSLRMATFRMRVENVPSLKGSPYQGLVSLEEARDGGHFELIIRSLDSVYGGTFATFRVGRTDVDGEEDAPVMGPETNDNTESEQTRGYISGFKGVRIESQFRREEWIEHKGQSIRVRGDVNTELPSFVVETDAKRMTSAELNDEDIGRWLFFKPEIINHLLGHRGFSLQWYTAETGGICSTSDRATHFGLNGSDLVSVYGCDIPRLEPWEQAIWAAQSIVPEGKVSKELLLAHAQGRAAKTKAAENLLIENLEMVEHAFLVKYKTPLFNHPINIIETLKVVSRFASKDKPSLLRLAKELVRVFSDRLNIPGLRTHARNKELGSIKLLEDILTQIIGPDKARELFGVIIGVYDMRNGDAHPTSSKIDDAIKLAGIDQDLSYLKQGQQMIHNYAEAIGLIGTNILDVQKNRFKG